MVLSFLAAFVVLLALVRDSVALHFTNTNWDVKQNGNFTIQWAYDNGDPLDGTWSVAIFLGDGGLYHLVGDVFYSTNNTNITSFVYKPTCNTLYKGSNEFTILFKKSGYDPRSWTTSPTWEVQNEGVCNPSTPLPTNTKVAIGVCMSLLFITFSFMGYNWYQRRRRERAAIRSKPVDTAPPGIGLELHNGEGHEGVPSYAGDRPPPYTPAT